MTLEEIYNNETDHTDAPSFKYKTMTTDALRYLIRLKIIMACHQVQLERCTTKTNKDLDNIPYFQCLHAVTNVKEKSLKMSQVISHLLSLQLSTEACYQTG